MGEMDQNRWAECVKIDQNEQNEMRWREPGHQNDATGPKWIFKMSQMHQNECVWIKIAQNGWNYRKWREDSCPKRSK